MDNYQNIITFIILGFFIAVGIHYLYNSQEQFDGGIIPLGDEGAIITERSDGKIKRVRKPRLDYSNRIMNFHNNKMPIDRITPDCPLEQNNQDTMDYLQKHLLGTSETCLLKPQTAKQFNKDFFSFRDKTENNSSMRFDSVDFMNQLYLEGNTDTARRYPNMKIQDLYDEATKNGPNFYTRSCVRLPKFDDINPENLTYEYGNPALHMVRDDWKYSNEKVMNGGEIMKGIVGRDPMEGNEKPY
jgi:hypothetical protein